VDSLAVAIASKLVVQFGGQFVVKRPWTYQVFLASEIAAIRRQTGGHELQTVVHFRYAPWCLYVN